MYIQYMHLLFKYTVTVAAPDTAGVMDPFSVCVRVCVCVCVCVCVRVCMRERIEVHKYMQIHTYI